METQLSKKTYTTPLLVVKGEIVELTQQIKTCGLVDGFVLNSPDVPIKDLKNYS